jgi:hypothetical protein
MDMNEADISAGSAKSVPAKHYAMYDMENWQIVYRSME